MTPLTIIRYLGGSRSAILEIAGTRWSLLVGAMLLASASLARNYDGAWLAGEWDVLLHGIVVSTGNAFVLFALMFVAAKGRAAGAPFWRGYLAFLGLFWMTSPMAWLYGIPWERFLEPLDAMQANMATLAVLSVWRVVLISRVLAVIFGERTRRAVWIVMVFSDAALLLALMFSPLPVIDFMGGMQHSPEERALTNAAFTAGFFGVVTGLVWISGAGWAASRMAGAWQVVSRTASVRSAAPAIVFAVVALLGWMGATLIAQPQQRRRFEAEKMLRAGRLEEAFKEMSRHQRSDYPAIWDPPPRHAWRIYEPDIELVRHALAEGEHAPWVERLFWEKCWRLLLRYPYGRGVLDEERILRDTTYFDERWWTGAALHAAYDQTLSEADRARLKALMEAREAPSSDSP